MAFEALGVLPSNKQGKVSCEIDGRVLGGMQLLVQVLVEVLVTVPRIDGRVLEGHAVWGAGAGAALGCCLGTLSIHCKPGMYFFLGFHRFTKAKRRPGCVAKRGGSERRQADSNPKAATSSKPIRTRLRPPQTPP